MHQDWLLGAPNNHTNNTVHMLVMLACCKSMLAAAMQVSFKKMKIPKIKRLMIKMLAE